MESWKQCYFNTRGTKSARAQLKYTKWCTISREGTYQSEVGDQHRTKHFSIYSALIRDTGCEGVIEEKGDLYVKGEN